MKRIIAILIALTLVVTSTHAVIFFLLAAPGDSYSARDAIRNRPELKPLEQAYVDLVQTRLLPLRFHDMPRIFGAKLCTARNWWGYGTTNSDRAGPKLREHPGYCVLPLFLPRGLGISGLHSIHPEENHHHTDLYAVHDFVNGFVAFLEFYSAEDGDTVQQATAYFCADEEFMPLSSTNAFAERLEWEQTRLARLKTWLEENLPPQTDLGQVEIPAIGPRQIQLGGEAYTVWAKDLNPTNSAYHVTIAKETSDVRERMSSWQERTVRREGFPVVFSVQGRYYRFIPKLLPERFPRE